MDNTRTGTFCEYNMDIFVAVKGLVLTLRHFYAGFRFMSGNRFGVII
jgi:hypothetical protein